MISDGAAMPLGGQDGEPPEAQPAAAALERIADARATRDVLTGLPNRAVMLDRIGQALADGSRSGGCTAVLSVGLDRLQQINAEHGRPAGDALARRVASQLAGALRLMDTVGRFDGGEFAVLTPVLESPIHAVDLSARLITELARRPRQGDDGEGVAASIGVAVSVGGRGTPESLLEEAGAAMRRARSLGGARAEVFDDSLWLKVQQRWIARQMLQKALDERRVAVHYQPIVDLADGRVTGYEGLARIGESDGSILPPGAFLPAAEDSGLVVSLGGQVLEQACRDARAWQSPDDTLAAPSVSVNLSARQFRSGDLPAAVRAQLKRSGLDPRQLHLELTETAITGPQPALIEQLRQLRDLGVQLGLDDFGSGLVSLTQLLRLPLTYVKIDRAIAQGDGSDPSSTQLLTGAIGLAAELGLRSIAEGVETDAQLERLRELGCDEAQGYLFARPLPLHELPETLRDHNKRSSWRL